MSEHRTSRLPSHDFLSRLARDDPQEFEALRRSLIEDCIDSAPERIRPRLRQLQFRVDGIRRRSASPLGATLKLQALMWESFLVMNAQLQAFSRRPRSCPMHRPVVAPVKGRNRPAAARIIDFKPRQAI